MRCFFSVKKGRRSWLPSWASPAEGVLLSVPLQPAPEPGDAHEGHGLSHAQAEESLKILFFGEHFCHYRMMKIMRTPSPCAATLCWWCILAQLHGELSLATAIRIQSHSAAWLLSLREFSAVWAGHTLRKDASSVCSLIQPSNIWESFSLLQVSLPAEKLEISWCRGAYDLKEEQVA